MKRLHVPSLALRAGIAFAVVAALTGVAAWIDRRGR